jgi:hypothetical protein
MASISEREGALNAAESPTVSSRKTKRLQAGQLRGPLLSQWCWNAGRNGGASERSAVRYSPRRVAHAAERATAALYEPMDAAGV